MCSVNNKYAQTRCRFRSRKMKKDKVDFERSCEQKKMNLAVLYDLIQNCTHPFAMLWFNSVYVHILNRVIKTYNNCYHGLHSFKWAKMTLLSGPSFHHPRKLPRPPSPHRIEFSIHSSSVRFSGGWFVRFSITHTWCKCKNNGFMFLPHDTSANVKGLGWIVCEKNDLGMPNVDWTFMIIHDMDHNLVTISWWPGTMIEAFGRRNFVRRWRCFYSYLPTNVIQVNGVGRGGALARRCAKCMW